MSRRERDAIRALLGDLLGPRVAVASNVPGEVPLSTLYPSELAAVASAVEGRRLEMAAGRAAAREALATFGLGEVELPPANGGAPAWPRGFVGSITHTHTLCVAAVARDAELAGLGIDAEPEAPLGDELWELITTDEELAELRGTAEAGLRARWIFCAKEAAYKCQYPLTGLLLDFGDLQIRWSNESTNLHDAHVQSFEAMYRRDAPPFRRGDRIPGLVGRAGGHVMAVAKLEPWQP